MKKRRSTFILFGRISVIILLLTVALFCFGCQRSGGANGVELLDSSPPESSMEAATSSSVPHAIAVPEGKPTAIDGVMAPGEWENAAVETFADGSELFLMYRAGYLYLGIRSITSEMIVGNIFIDRGDEIDILHASAALGTARYAKEESFWQQTQAFDWRCRETGNGAAAQAARAAFLEEEGWTAANSRTGTPNELEYQIELTGDTLRLAANLLRSSNTDAKIPWPKDLEDDVITPSPGGLPEQLHFSPEQWATIDISH